MGGPSSRIAPFRRFCNIPIFLMGYIAVSIRGNNQWVGDGFEKLQRPSPAARAPKQRRGPRPIRCSQPPPGPHKGMVVRIRCFCGMSISRKYHCTHFGMTRRSFPPLGDPSFSSEWPGNPPTSHAAQLDRAAGNLVRMCRVNASVLMAISLRAPPVCTP